MSWATWILFTGAPAWCVALLVQRPGPIGSCSPLCSLRALRSLPCPGKLGSFSPVCLLGVLWWVRGVLGHLAPVHWCACSVRCVPCAVSWATWLLFTLVHARCVVLRVRCPGPLCSCSPVCSLCVLCCMRGVLVLLARVLRCAGSVCHAVCCVSGVLGHLAPFHRCVRSVCCVACAGRR